MFASIGPDYTRRNGTTNMAIEFDGGVMILGGPGHMKAIVGKIFCFSMGSIEDTASIADEIVSSMRRSIIRNPKKEPLVEEAAAAANIQKTDGLWAGTIVAGWDSINGGQFYQISPEGMCNRRSYAIGGSDSSGVHDFIREHFREKMSRAEAIELVRKTILHFEGSLVDRIHRIYNITKKGMGAYSADYSRDREDFYLRPKPSDSSAQHPR